MLHGPTGDVLDHGCKRTKESRVERLLQELRVVMRSRGFKERGRRGDETRGDDTACVRTSLGGRRSGCNKAALDATAA